MSTVAHVIFHEPPPLTLTQIGPAVQRAMQKDPAARFASIRDFVAATGARRAFNAAVSPATLNSTQGEVALPPSWRRQRTKRTVSIVAAGLVLATLSALGLSMLSNKRLDSPRAVPLADRTNPRPAVYSAPSQPPVQIPLPPSSPPESPKEELTPTPTSVSPMEPARPASRPQSGSLKSPERAPRPVTPRPAGSPSAVSPSVPSGVSGFEISLSGVSDAQQKLIKQCCIKELKPLTGMPKTYKIVLQRSGTLHIVEAPEEVRQTDLGQCLRNAFPLGEVPAAVTVHVRGNR